MATYLAKRIEVGALDYSAVVVKYPQLKADIDAVLIADGYSNKIV